MRLSYREAYTVIYALRRYGKTTSIGGRIWDFSVNEGSEALIPLNDPDLAALEEKFKAIVRNGVQAEFNSAPSDPEHDVVSLIPTEEPETESTPAIDKQGGVQEDDAMYIDLGGGD